MTKDPRYKGIKVLIETENIIRLDQIFDEHKFPVTVIAQFIGTNFTRMSKYINNPALFTFGEASRLAGYFEVPDEIMHKLIYRSMVENRDKKNAGVKKKNL